MMDQRRMLKAELDEKDVHIQGLHGVTSGIFLPKTYHHEENKTKCSVTTNAAKY